jgi:formate dehydrogenase subunit gamma
MPALVGRFRLVIASLAVLLLAAVAVPATAQQPSSVNPTAASVKEEQLLKALKEGGAIEGRVSIPDHKAGRLIQPGGRDWRHFHEAILPKIGAIAIMGMLALLVVFYLWRGMIKIEGGRSGRTILRFNGFERFVHWMTATCFIVLALSGLNITFGKQLLLPLLGPDAFTAVSQWGKYAHNFLSFPFTLGVAVILLMWVAWAIPNAADAKWLAEGGGLVGNQHPRAGRFNAGQKMIYWVVVLGGAAVAASGYVMMFPFYVTDMAGMQVTQMIHGVAALLFVAVMLAHIYIGTIGMEGAFEGMGTGEVDLNWAKQHHPDWLDEQARKGRPLEGARGPVATPAE